MSEKTSDQDLFAQGDPFPSKPPQHKPPPEPPKEPFSLEERIMGTLLAIEDASERGKFLAEVPEGFWQDKRLRALAGILLSANGGGTGSGLLGIWKAVDAAEAGRRVGGVGYISSLVDQRFAGDPQVVFDELGELLGEKALSSRAQQVLEDAQGALKSGKDPGEVLWELTESSQKALAHTKSPLGDAAVSARELLENKPEDPGSLVGERILVRGGLGLLSGKAGLGKTFLMLQLAGALSEGAEWLGVKCQKARVGLLELEIPHFELHERLGGMKERDEPLDLDNLFVVSPPHLPYLPALPSSRHVADIISFIKTRELDLFVIDPISEAHALDENSASDMGRVFSALRHIQLETGCAILLLHHEPKGSDQDKKRTLEDIDRPRGSTRFSQTPNCIFILRRTGTGTLELRFGKTTFCRKPQPILLNQNDIGLFEVLDEDPVMANTKGTKAENLVVLGEELADRLEPIHVDDVMSLLPHIRSERTVRRMLSDMGWEPYGPVADKMWIRKDLHPEKKQDSLEGLGTEAESSEHTDT